MLAKIRALNRLECVGETLFHTFNVLALVAPEWLRIHAEPQWRERYAHRSEDYRLPTSKEARQQYAEVIGQDGWTRLDRLAAPDAPDWLLTIPAVHTLHMIWEQQYHPQAAGGTWRTEDQMFPSGQVCHSPYDLCGSTG